MLVNTVAAGGMHVEFRRDPGTSDITSLRHQHVGHFLKNHSSRSCEGFIFTEKVIYFPCSSFYNIKQVFFFFQYNVCVCVGGLLPMM